MTPPFGLCFAGGRRWAGAQAEGGDGRGPRRAWRQSDGAGGRPRAQVAEELRPALRTRSKCPRRELAVTHWLRPSAAGWLAGRAACGIYSYPPSLVAGAPARNLAYAASVMPLLICCCVLGRRMVKDQNQANQTKSAGSDRAPAGRHNNHQAGIRSARGNRTLPAAAGGAPAPAGGAQTAS